MPSARRERRASTISAFAGNGALLASDSSTFTSVVLGGSRAAHTHANVTGTGVPAFDRKLNDQQIANILTYLRKLMGQCRIGASSAAILGR